MTASDEVQARATTQAQLRTPYQALERFDSPEGLIDDNYFPRPEETVSAQQLRKNTSRLRRASRALHPDNWLTHAGNVFFGFHPLWQQFAAALWRGIQAFSHLLATILSGVPLLARGIYSLYENYNKPELGKWTRALIYAHAFADIALGITSILVPLIGMTFLAISCTVAFFEQAWSFGRELFTYLSKYHKQKSPDVEEAQRKFDKELLKDNHLELYENLHTQQDETQALTDPEQTLLKLELSLKRATERGHSDNLAHRYKLAHKGHTLLISAISLGGFILFFFPPTAVASAVILLGIGLYGLLNAYDWPGRWASRMRKRFAWQDLPKPESLARADIEARVALEQNRDEQNREQNIEQDRGEQNIAMTGSKSPSPAQPQSKFKRRRRSTNLQVATALEQAAKDGEECETNTSTPTLTPNPTPPIGQRRNSDDLPLSGKRKWTLGLVDSKSARVKPSIIINHSLSPL